MERRPLGRTGHQVSALGLGCMGMSEFYGARDDVKSMQTLEAALAHGIDFFDTSDTYGFGHNEELVGRFLKNHRGKITLATKFGIVRQEGRYERRIDNSPAYIAQACDASLGRLGIERIDLYYAHRLEPARPIEETVAAMAKLVEAGKVRWLGLSEVSAATLRRAHKIHPITALQTEYSLWSRESETELLQTCRELGVSFVAYSPLGRAFLTGTVTSTDALAPTDFRRNNPRFQADALERNRKLTDALANFAKARHATPAQMALAWLLGKHRHVIPIPGTKRSAYVIENASAATIRLSAEEIATLDRMFPPEAVAGDRYTPEGMKGLGL
ncbi:aldo/keto reductase [Hypericibacter sp.]|uniref:aldo/keto reductase n=1 Tax=Hypericibacter sp. TaxID=2705401 RepID=UPI003D6D4AD2